MAPANPESGSPERQLSDLTAAVRELGQIMRESGLHKLEVEDGRLSIRLLTAGGKVKYVAASSPSEPGAFESGREDETEPTPGQIVTSPMVGTYYASPAPGQPAFVSPGDRVQPRQTIGIIEAMKMMNQIEAEVPGRVVRILVRDAQGVEYGQPLMVIAEG